MQKTIRQLSAVGGQDPSARMYILLFAASLTLSTTGKSLSVDSMREYPFGVSPVRQPIAVRHPGEKADIRLGPGRIGRIEGCPDNSFGSGRPAVSH